MKINSLAGSPAPPAMLANIPKLVTAYYTDVPDFSVPTQRVAFGTSGHRGYSFEKTFNEGYVLAISQAICLYRTQQGINGPLFLGIDTHALSVPAFVSALEVLAANGVKVMLAENDEYTPTPAVSHAILTYNRGRDKGLADGIVITPSHNPPNGGPADTGVTEDIYKIYAESFRGEDHLRRILEEAQSIVSDALTMALEQDRGGVSAGLHQQAVSEKPRKSDATMGALTDAFGDSVQNTFEGVTMCKQTPASKSTYGLLPTADVEGFDSLAELALDMRWSWNHATDQVWRRLDQKRLHCAKWWQLNVCALTIQIFPAKSIPRSHT